MPPLTLLVLAASPLAECTPHPYGRSGLAFDCKSFIATMQLLPSGGPLEPAVQLELSSLRDSVTHLTFTSTEVTREATAWKGSFQITPASNDDPERLVGCFEAPTGKQCAAVTKYLATTPSETLADEGEVTLDFAGERLKAPPGCNAMAPARITCRGNELTWSHDVPASTLAQKEKDFLALFARQKAHVVRTTIKCTHGGVPATCTRFTVTTRSQFTALMAWAVVRGQKVFALCNGGTSDTLPPNCAMVFSTP
ncbi:MAG: hypothetical protein DI536_15430 [Archangium gephyra]|uniref:Uncharacterized protein n=1 Tax=Archangium gephyra TaxID=48 RepID=A0A2W5V8U3_9BACT|nr:MAG: hypothetical protein DI536_15430 [Archangium gephyra]